MNAQQGNFVRQRRGFAAIVAISLIILVGAALVVLGQRFANDMARTQAQKGDAQLRQLLIAAAAAAVQRADHPAVEESVALPAWAAGDDAGISVRVFGAGDERSADIRVRLAGREVSQILHLHRSAGGWKVR